MKTTSTAGAAREASEYWWIFLVTGSLWILFSLLLFRFHYASVNAIAILVGIFCLAAAVGELVAVPVSHGWALAGRLALALGFAIVGVVAFVNPGGTFNALAAVFAFYLFLRGIFDVVVALVGRLEFWWLRLIAGIVQIGLAFWAAGDFGHKTILLLAWIGLSALIHGITEIVLAFELRGTPATA